MKKELAIKKMMDIRRRLTGVDIENCIDDGYDSNDALQNDFFVAGLRQVKELHDEFKSIDIDGMTYNDRIATHSAAPKPDNWHAPEQYYSWLVGIIDAELQCLQS